MKAYIKSQRILIPEEEIESEEKVELKLEEQKYFEEED